MTKERRKDFIFGTLFGIVATLNVIFVLRYFGIQIFIFNSITQDIYDKSEVIEQCIDEYYQGEINEEDIVNGAAKGMVDALGDKYSQYFTEEEYEELMNGINGSYVGIGVTLTQKEDLSIVVTEVSEGGPAAQAGIQKDDRIIRVDGTDVTNTEMSDMISMIKKEANDGKTIVITVERAGENGQVQTLDKEVVCGKVDVVSVRSKKIGTAGYIKITEFDKETDKQFGTAIENMRNDDVSGLVIDVRDNGGGSLDSTINMLDEILPEGELITEKSKKDGDETYHSTDDTSFSKPIVVLINENSASASEVFAGTLQARKAATLVGTKSFGKGIVQTVLSLENSCGGGLKLTTAEYFLPGGISIHKKGLVPDIELEAVETEGEYTEEKDNQLQRALEIVSQKEEN